MEKETSSVKFWKCAIYSNFVSVKWNGKAYSFRKGGSCNKLGICKKLVRQIKELSFLWRISLSDTKGKIVPHAVLSRQETLAQPLFSVVWTVREKWNCEIWL